MTQYTVDPELDRAIRTGDVSPPGAGRRHVDRRLGAGMWHEGQPAPEVSPWGHADGLVMHAVSLP